MAFLIYREDRELSPGFYYGFVLIILAVVLQTIRHKKSSGIGQEAPGGFGL